MKEFARALASNQDDPLSCQACEEMLAEYIDAEQQGQGRHPQFGQLRRHLQLCPHCAASYRELRLLTELAYGEPLARPSRQPNFDLGFFPSTETKAAQTKQRFWWDDIGRFVVQLSNDLLGSMQPALQPALARVKSQGEETLLYYTVGETGGDLRLTVEATAQSDHPDRCTLSVEADIPSRGGWPNLAETQITIKRGDEVLASDWTDEFGKVVFTNVERAALPELTIEVSPQD